MDQISSGHVPLAQFEEAGRMADRPQIPGVFHHHPINS